MPETRTIGTLSFERLGSAWYCRTVIATPATPVIVEVRRVFGAGYAVEVVLGESCRKAADEREIGAALLCRSSLLASAHRIPEAALGEAVGRVLDHAVDRLMPPPQPEQVVEEPVAAPRFDPASTAPRPLRVGSFKHREVARAGFRGLAAIGDAVARGMVLELRGAEGPEAPALRGAITAAIPGTCVVAFDCAITRGDLEPGEVRLDFDVPCTGQCPKLRVAGWRAESAIGDRGTWIEGVLDFRPTGNLHDDVRRAFEYARIVGVKVDREVLDQLAEQAIAGVELMEQRARDARARDAEERDFWRRLAEVDLSRAGFRALGTIGRAVALVHEHMRPAYGDAEQTAAFNAAGFAWGGRLARR